MTKHETELRLAKAEGLIFQLVGHEDSPCRFDHHGECQEHGNSNEDGECVIAQAREFLGFPRSQRA